MSPALAQKAEKRNRLRGGQGRSASDAWAPPEFELNKPRRAIKRQMHRHSGSTESAPRFRSSAFMSDQTISKVRGRLANPRRGQSEQTSILLLPPLKLKGQAETAPRVSLPRSLDQAAAEVKRLAGENHPSDEDFIRVARILRKSMKNELHSDPPMADVCLVIADALTFTSPDKLQPGALRVLDAALYALGKPRGEPGDERRVFSQFVQAGWRVTPAYEENELAAWIEQMSS